jgi:type I restriction enzyme S subunit
MKNKWPTKTLGEVCDVIGGGTPSKANSKYYKGDIPWATVRDMHSEVLEKTEHKITEQGLTNSSANIIPKGNVIIATRVGLGKVCVLKQDTAINQDLRGIIPRQKNILTQYLFQWAKSIAHVIEAEGTGSTVKGVKLPFLKSLPIPIPPLPEQKRIVRILDETFALIDKAKANAEKNLQNACELFESSLHNIFAHPGKKWQGKRIDQISENLDSKRIPVTKRNRKEGQYPYYGASGIVDYVNSFIFDEELLLVSEDGANLLARTYPIAFSVHGKIWVNNHAHVLRFSHRATQKYIEYYLNSIPLTEYVGGMAQPKLNQTMLNSILVLLPSLQEQVSIVSNCEQLHEKTKKLEAIYQQKLANLEELKKSILHKAFNGELTEVQQ